MKLYALMHTFQILILFYSIVFEIGSNTDKLIHILIWDQPHFTPMLNNYPGQKYFIYQNCSFQNCFLTSNRSIFSNVTSFDAILFNVIALKPSEAILPSNRSTDQIYIFMSNEPASMYHVSSHYNGVFNYTFTYKLDSDTTWRFYVVRNKKGKVIAPKLNAKWMDINDMEPIGEEIIRRLQTKNKAAAWHVSHCHTPSRREEFVDKLITELAKYKLSVDITGNCGDLHCQAWTEECHTAIETDYYFYLAFENSMCVDYVSEKILTATQHYSVPIVLGGADYSR